MARALEIWPSNPDVQYWAAGVYGDLGDKEAQDRHNRIGYTLHVRQSKSGGFKDFK